MPLFKILGDETVTQIRSSVFSKEKILQKLVEKNLETLLGIRFIASEYTTGDRQRGRIDTLGLDQDGTPTIIEYKKTSKENVINQGLFYLDWLVDHKGDFTLKAQEVLGNDVEIDWNNSRLILIAESFNQYDKYAVNRIGANIELWVYRLYGNDLFYLEQIYASLPAKPRQTSRKGEQRTPEKEEEPVIVYTVEEHLEGKLPEIKVLFDQLREQISSLGEDIIEKPLKTNIAYKHGKNFCEVWIQNRQIKLWLDINPADLNDPFHLSRDVSSIGHWGTGDVEVTLKSTDKLDAVMALIEQAYQQTV